MTTGCQASKDASEEHNTYKYYRQALTGTSRHVQIMLCICVWYWTALSPSQNTAKESGRHHMHHRLMKQTQSKLQIVFNKLCLHMTSKRQADRAHLLDAEVLRAAGHLETAGSACFQILPSMQTWRHQPNTFLSVCLCQLHQHLVHRLLYLGWVACIMHAQDGWDDMGKLISGLASCPLCNAVEY